jgi:hypothetical protein
MKLLVCVSFLVAVVYGEVNNPSQPQEFGAFGVPGFSGNEFPPQPMIETATDASGNPISTQPSSDAAEGQTSTPVPLDEQKQKDLAAAVHRQIFPPIQYPFQQNPNFGPYPVLAHPFGAPYIPIRMATDGKKQLNPSDPNLTNAVEEQPKNGTTNTTASVGGEVKLVVLPGASYLQPAVPGAAPYVSSPYLTVPVQAPYYYYYGAPVAKVTHQPQKAFPFGYQVTQVKK